MMLKQDIKQTVNKNEINKLKLEQERERLHILIENGASLEEIQHQSEILDKYIVAYYSMNKQSA